MGTVRLSHHSHSSHGAKVRGLVDKGVFFFFNDTATTEIYTLSLHDALPIFEVTLVRRNQRFFMERHTVPRQHRDRKSTRLNSSHLVISYAVFCLKKKKKSIVSRGDAHHCNLIDYKLCAFTTPP